MSKPYSAEGSFKAWQDAPEKHAKAEKKLAKPRAAKKTVFAEPLRAAKTEPALANADTAQRYATKHVDRSSADAAWHREMQRVERMEHEKEAQAARSAKFAEARRKHLSPVRGFLGKDVTSSLDRQFQGQSFGVHHSDLALGLGIMGTAVVLIGGAYLVAKPSAPKTAGADEPNKRTFWNYLGIPMRPELEPDHIIRIPTAPDEEEES